MSGKSSRTVDRVRRIVSKMSVEFGSDPEPGFPTSAMPDLARIVGVFFHHLSHEIPNDDPFQDTLAKVVSACMSVANGK